MNAKKLKDRIVDLLYPTRAVCLGCGDERGCRKPFLCDICRVLLDPVNVVAAHRKWQRRYLSQVAFAHYYGRPVRGMIHAYKFRSVRMLAGRFAKEMAELIKGRGLGPYDMIIPVPLHPARQMDRGFNQSQLLAEELSAICGIPVRTDILFRIRKTRQQAKLSHDKRSKNLEKAFEARVSLDGMRVLLLDDVVTTGSTLCACAEALHEKGAEDVQAIAIAGVHSVYSAEQKDLRLRPAVRGMTLIQKRKKLLQKK